MEVFEIVRAPEEAISKTLELFTSKLRKSPLNPELALMPKKVPEALPDWILEEPSWKREEVEDWIGHVPEVIAMPFGSWASQEFWSVLPFTIIGI